MADDRKRLSIVIVNWNGRQLLQGCLASLNRQITDEVEIIVVDNGSEDDSVAYLQANHPHVRILSLSENLGFAAGNNHGAEIATGEFLFLVNNDTECAPNLVEAILRGIIEYPDYDRFACKMLSYTQRDRIDNCGIGYSIWGAGVQLAAGRESSKAAYNTPHEVFGASGGAMVCRKSLFDSLGGFDETFHSNNEDTDFSFRAQLIGQPCMFLPDTIVYHMGSATYKRTGQLQMYQVQRNMEFVYFKNFPLSLMLIFGFLHIAYILFSALRWGVQGYGITFLRAKKDAIRALPRVLKQRRAVQQARIVTVGYLYELFNRRL